MVDTGASIKIKQLRKIKGKTQSEFADILGVSQGNIADIENGRREPSKEFIRKVIDEFGVNANWLLGNDDQMFSGIVKEAVVSYVAKESVRVPLLGKIPAGFPQVVSQEVFKEYVYLPQAPKGSYALIVKGDSMRPTISDGDYVLFKPDGQYADGSIVVASNEYGDPTLKRYRIKEGVVRLVSDNPEFHALDISEQWRVLGVVIKVWRDVKF